MPTLQVLLLDDDPSFRAAVRESVDGWCELVEAASIQEFRAVWELRRFALLLLDMRLRSDREGMDVLRHVFAQDATQPVIMLSAYGDSESAIEAVGAGAMMFLHKQEFSPSHLIRMMEAVIEQGRLRRQLRAWRRQAWDQLADALVGQSDAMREVVNNLRTLAREANSCTVLLAEPGCGASLAARVLHRAGLGADDPFLEVGAGSITAAGERFFTSVGAGWLEAEQGTLAISGAEALPLELGRRILDRDKRGPRSVVFLLREEALLPHSCRAEAPAAALPRWLAAVNPWPLRLPPLRERRDDIPLLTAHFLQRQRSLGRSSARVFSGAVMARLEAHSWPGNVRELRQVVDFAALQASLAGQEELGIAHLPSPLLADPSSSSPHTGRDDASNWNYKQSLARAELALAEQAMREQGLRHKSALAAALGYADRFTFGRRLEKALRDFPSLAAEFPSIAGLFAKPAAP
jgi:DNA-binding NtrC family response regulator